jgi:hypothetical protein
VPALVTAHELGRVRKEDCGMPSLDCPSCEGSGYVQGEGGTIIICARCDGTGVVFVDEDTTGPMIGAEG